MPPELLDDKQAQITKRDMVCSICWRSLVIYHAPDRMNEVLCREHGKDTPGYVSKAWAERQKAEQQADFRDVKRAYPELAEGEGHTPAADEDESDKQLGF